MTEEKPTPMSRADSGRLGAQRANAVRTPEQRKEFGRRAYLATAVNVVIDRVAELNPVQEERLRALFLERTVKP